MSEGVAFLLAFGGIWFWAFFLILNIFLIWCASEDRGWWATAATIASLGALQFGFGVPIIGFMIDQPILFALSIFGYFIVGTGNALWRWYSFVKDQRAKYDLKRQAFCKKHHMEPNELIIPAILRTEFKEYILAKPPFIEVPPQSNRHKFEICTWIGYWPWSVLFHTVKFICGDMIKRVCNFIYRSIAGVLQSISNSVFHGTNQDMN